jgi:hypothetical protein
MNGRTSGAILFGAGAALMGLAVILGKYFLTELHQLGLIGFEAAYGSRGMLKFLLFALGFPLGAGLAVLGMLVRAGAPAARVALFAAAAVLGAFGSVLVPLAFGTRPSPAYFGTGGIVIMLLALATAWFWGKHRARLAEASARTAADLQALGYLCFALAAWNLCGVGGMPGFALYPDKMIALDARDFAVGQMKVVMAFFVAGWLFTALGWWRRQD